MRRRAELLLFGVVALGLSSAALQCAEPDETSYGNPNTLDRKSLPGEGGVTELSCGAGGGGDGGGGGGGGGDGGKSNCPSFERDIFPNLAPNGKWRCADTACHGGVQAPKIDGTTAAACVGSLRAITVAGKPFLSGGSSGGDPSGAGFLCNMQGTCGVRMPQPPGQDPSEAELCTISAWLECGAPQN